uniref:Uncharacterized protein n=1 Tax=Anguilla anguilla TaxID=7936 RepID=A0A0E9TAH1_ANGAN
MSSTGRRCMLGHWGRGLPSLSSCM